MVEGEEFAGTVHALVIEADDATEKDEKSEARDGSDSTGVHLS